MKKYYKFATLLIVLCICFAVTGCFGGAGTMQNYSEARKQVIKTECKNNLLNIALACEMYAADHERRYPKNLDILTSDKEKYQYIKEIPKCPIDQCEYKFVSKFSPQNDKHDNMSYYILKCQKHPFLVDSNVEFLDADNLNGAYIEGYGSLTEYYNSIKNGKIHVNLDKSKEITLTPEELKELGFK